MTVSGNASDEDLAGRALLGDHAAFEVIALRYQAKIYALACRLVGVDEASDIVQETLLSAYRHLATFRGESKLSTWLYRIATNAAMMHRRSRARRPAESLDPFLPVFDAAGVHQGTPSELQIAENIDRIVEHRLLAEKVTEALDRLPDTCRDAFVLRDLEELSTQEVAEVLGVEPAAVRQRVHRARLLLRGFLTSVAREAR